MNKYDPIKTEAKWQKIWQETEIYKTPVNPKDKFYNLVMFPYPSGDLHIGHWYNFGPADTLGRFTKMHGKDVLQPLGYDAFGLPAENAAIKRGIPADEWTDKNVANFRKQYARLGGIYDLDKEVNTSKPDYYRWTQWMFVKLFREGKAYQKDGLVNWCPQDKTVLANEQVVHGECERCGTKVERKNLKQWYFKITDYADRLLSDLDTLDWPERIKEMQRNWIGRSEGALIHFAIDGSNDKLDVYTTRPDTLFGVTFMVIAPEHPLVGGITTDAHRKDVDKYVDAAGSKTDIDRMENQEKTGVFTGSYAVNPATNEQIPIWVSDYVLMGYGTGAIMAVPAHDERDYEFATKFGLEIKPVIEPVTGKPQKKPEFRRSIVAIVRNPKDGKVLSINWGRDGGNLFIGGGVDEDEDLVEAAKREVAEETGYKNLKLVSQSENIHHHYFAHSKNKARQILATGLLFDLVDESKNDQKLEKDEKGKFKVEWLSIEQAGKKVVDELHKLLFEKFILGSVHSGQGKLINSDSFDGQDSEEGKKNITTWLETQNLGQKQTQYRLRDWLISRQRYWGAPIPIIHCEQCGAVPVPEKDLPVVLPLKQKFGEDGRSPLHDHPDFAKAKCPECGGEARRETDTMDTFVDSSWYFLRYPNPSYEDGPFDPLAVKQWLPVDRYIGGAEHAVLHLLYARFFTKFLFDQGHIDFEEPFKKLINQGMILGPDGNKMSKSKGNVVDPDDYVNKFGADSVRMYLMFMGPYDEGGPWDPKRFEGTYRFINKAWELTTGEYIASTHDSMVESELESRMHKTIKKVTEDVTATRFNTAIASLMEFVNYAGSVKLMGQVDRKFWDEVISTLTKLLAPFAPFLTEEIWEQNGNGESVHLQAWPEYDPKLVKDDVVTIVIQVNGKLRGEFVVNSEEAHYKDELESQAREQMGDKLKFKEVVKTIVVPGKLVNFVTKQ